MNKSMLFTRSLLIGALALALAATANAQDSQSIQKKRAALLMLEEVVVTARKREEGSQDIPLAISAFNSDQLDAMKFRNLTNLAVGMPSVVLDEIGTSRGYANFSIRGLGINSSIPSIDPSVGMVVDGIYLGINGGVVFDTFDVQSVEVLRGPQGTLFGRNVTGGAVLLNTKNPSDDFSFDARAVYETPEHGGASTTVMATLSGALTNTMSAKLAVYHNDDDGALVNSFDGQNHGAYQQTIIRPVIAWHPTDTFELIARYERQEVTADGPSAQSHTNGRGLSRPVNFERDSFDFSIDNPGLYALEVDFFNTTINWEFAGGTLTNVFGYRDSYYETDADIDSQPTWIFHSDTHTGYEQISNELRWNGLMMNDALNLTMGVYYFESALEYDEDRNFGNPETGEPASVQSGGGIQDVTSLGIFLSGDYNITDRFTLITGVRFTREEKEAQVATIPLNIDNECNIGRAGGVSMFGQPEEPCTFDFADDKTWSFISPRLGLMYELNDSARMYATWSRGFRSGGYNMRNNEDPIVYGPGPFDDEQVDTIELGYKTEWDRGQLNFAIYRTQVLDMQREVNLPQGENSLVQLIVNTADAEIFGFEVDGTFVMTDNLILKASLGWLSAEYVKVDFDLSGDGLVNEEDESLNLPRAPEMTYSLSAIHDMDISSLGYLSSRITYAFRDETAYTDNNLGYILKQNSLDAGFDFHMAGGQWVLSLYGRNLMDAVRHGGDTQFGASGTFSPLNRPKTYGVEVSYNL